MIVCKAKDCVSSQDTKVDGREILFFAFPEDETKRKQWLQNCKLSPIDVNDTHWYLCELHFEKMSFSSSKELKPTAVPTIFDKIEETSKKRKGESPEQTCSSKLPPLKQKKLDDESQSLVTPPQSPFIQTNENIMEVKQESEKAKIPHENETTLNGSTTTKSDLYVDVNINKKIYRLTIQIDKIRCKPGPKSTKFMYFMERNKDMQNFSLNENKNGQKNLSRENFNKTLSCEMGGCKLRKSMYESKPAFQCERCDKYYVMKKGDNPEDKNNSCSICHKSFPSSQSLYLHVKKHFICDMCQTECNAQVTYDKHVRLHVNTDPLYPYKCHQCTEIFELKEDVRQHYLIVHPTIQLQNTILQVTASPITPQMPQKDYRCVSCNITFRNEQAYRNHVNSHKKKEGLRCNISDTNNIFPVHNPLAGSQIGILRAVKFSCRVCSKEFDNVGEVDKHTRTHLEDVEEEHKCNICKKLFKTSALLNEHLKHHLSRAHPCPICPKAFINRTTLKIHLKTHGEA